MSPSFELVSPVDGRLITTVPFAKPGEIARTLDSATSAQKAWSQVPVLERISIIHSFVEAMEAKTEEYSRLLTLQMGRPIAHTPGEIAGLAERARYLASIAEQALDDIVPPAREGLVRFVRREPLGVVLVLAPWNYPYLTAVNTVVPAILAGNSVILKHSDQTPLVADHFRDAFRTAGLPEGVFQVLHMTHATTAAVIQDQCIDHVAFTGSVEGGRAVLQAAQDRARVRDFIGVGLELGGKDPAYVRLDADLNHAVPNVVEGALFNAGQSCCAIERVYVHREIHDEFLAKVIAETQRYILGNPLDEKTTLGPVVRQRSADAIRAQVTAALEAGARPHIDPLEFPLDRADTPYMAPQVLSRVDHKMEIMREETFGPVLPIMAVDGDEQAIELMNDCKFGLTASLWTQDSAAAMQMAESIQAGTVYLNRCDYLDPALAWTGLKQTGRGTTLSSIGFEQLTQPKSYHFRISF